MTPNLSNYFKPALLAVSVGIICHAKVNAAYPTNLLRDSLPQQWDYSTAFSQQLPDDDQWWKDFNDPTLDTLISLATNNNFNLATAARRLEIARNNISLARAAYYPTIGLNASFTRERVSGVSGNTPGQAAVNQYATLELNASWEIDLFGKITSKVKSQKALYTASKAEYAAAMVSLCSELAKDYIQLRVWQAQLNIAREHINAQRRIVDITTARLEAGIGSMLDVSQAKTVLYSTEATIPPLENSIRTMINSIALLTGLYADQLPVNVAQSSPLPDWHRIVSAGIPAQLLRRRPDIVEAEAQLASDAAQLGVAKKEFLPTLTIEGTIGTQAHRAGDLFTGSSFTYSVTPMMSWTIFSGLSRQYNIANARRQIEIDIDNYNLTVMNAVNETDNAMTSYLAALRHIDCLTSVVNQSDKAFELSVDLYKQGLTAFSNVSDAQMSLIESQSAVISAQGDALTSLIGLYQALGGGWSADQMNN